MLGERLLRGGRRAFEIAGSGVYWPPPGAPRSVTVAADTCTQAGSYSTLAMLQGEGAEAFLEAEGVRYWVLR